MHAHMRTAGERKRELGRVAGWARLGEEGAEKGGRKGEAAGPILLGRLAESERAGGANWATAKREEWRARPAGAGWAKGRGEKREGNRFSHLCLNGFEFWI